MSPPPGSSLRLCLTGVFLLSLTGLRGGALSTAEAAPRSSLGGRDEDGAGDGKRAA